MQITDFIIDQTWPFFRPEQAKALLEAKARQQAAVATLGQQALAGVDLPVLFDHAVVSVSETLEVEYCKLLELLPDGRHMLLRAGVGWQAGLVGQITVSAGLESQAGFTLLSEEPVIVEDLRTETRFSGPPLLHSHGVISGVSVIIGPLEKPFGALGAHTARRHTFTQDDVHFLQAVANVLASAIDRKQAEQALQQSHALLQAVIQSTADPIYLKDRDGRYLMANSATGWVVAKPVEEIIGRRHTEIFPPKQSQEIKENDQLVIQSGRAHTFENEILTPAGARIYHTHKAPYRDAEGNIVGLIGISRDITDLKRVELSHQLLAEAGQTLSSSLDYETRLAKVAHLAVPRLADWCSVVVVEEDEAVKQLTVAHVDPAKVKLAHELQQRYPPDWTAAAGAPEVLRSGRAELYPEVSDEMLVAAAHDEEHLRSLRTLQMKSAMIVPLVTRGRSLGVMTFVWAESNRRYSEVDLGLAEELARRAATAIDNARLFDKERRSRRRTEQAAQRIASLQAVTAALSRALTPLQVANVVIKSGLAALGANSGLIALVDAERTHLEIVRSFGYSTEQVKAWRTFPLTAPVPLAETVRSGEAIFISSSEALQTRFPEFAQQRTGDYEALVSLPLLGEEQTIGCIGLSFSKPTDFNAESREFMLSIARQCAQALERARLYKAEKDTRRAAERTMKRIASLQAITASLSEALTPGQVAQVLTKQGLSSIGADSGLVVLLAEESGQLETIHYFGYPATSMSDWQRFSLSTPVPLAETVRTGQARFIESRRQLKRECPEFPFEAFPGYEAMVALPLQSKGRAIGGIAMSFTEPRSFDEEDRTFMMAVTQQCAQALERARLYEAEQQARAEAEAVQERLALMAEIKERNRLAQELHDTVAQALGYLNLKMAVAMTLLDQGQTEEVQASLQELKQVIGETYTDVREEIFNLRSSATPQVNFLETLHDYVAKYKRFYDLEIQLVSEASPASFDFSAEVSIQLIRTIQEALINIRKHARVREARIRLSRTGQQVCISVEDQGQGFDSSRIAGQGTISFGLQIMQERIKKIGGDLEIDTSPGRGTRITLCYNVPRVETIRSAA